MTFLVDVGIVIVSALVCALIVGILRQPLLIGYLLAGVVVGPMGASLISDYETVQTISELGVAFLLFIVGLELDVDRLRRLGVVPLAVGLGQVFFTFLVSLWMISWFGVGGVEAYVLAFALTLSSTVIVVKLYGEKGALNTVHGQLTLAILLVQDVFAIGALSLVSGADGFSGLAVALAMMKGFVFVVVALLCGHFVFPVIFKVFARGQELLFLASLAVFFAAGGVAYVLGLSIAIGAFLSGVSLASLPYHYEIVNRTRSLRDFFGIIFFVALGMQIVFFDVGSMIGPVLLSSLFVLVGNAVLVMLLLCLFGFTARTGFFVGVAVAQISEFSLVFVALAAQGGLVSQGLVSLTAMIAMVTFVVSSYFIMYDAQLYRWLAPVLKWMERFSVWRAKKGLKRCVQEFDLVLFGGNRTGHYILEFALSRKMRVLVVDWNPERIHLLSEQGVPCMFGDVADPDVLSRVDWCDVKLVVSTVPDVVANSFLVDRAKRVNPKVLVFARAKDAEEAFELYNAGVDFVILPHFIGGKFVAGLLRQKNVRGVVLRARREQVQELRRSQNLYTSGRKKGVNRRKRGC